MSDVPDELLREVLSRLPVAPLLRFRCVSKSWKGLIDSDEFTRHHLIHSRKTNSDLNIVFTGHQVYSAYFDLLNETNLPTCKELPHPLKTRFDVTKILGSCDGLLVLRNDKDDIIILWNPSVRRLHVIPCITSIEIPGYWKISYYGFGYDVMTDDYKLISIGQFLGGEIYEFYSEVQIYSLKSDCWRRIADFPYYIDCVKTKKGVLANGSLHWIVNEDSVKSVRLIAAFDLGTEEYRLVPFPKFAEDDDTLRFEVAVLGGCLSLTCYAHDNHVDVWIMKDYGVQESWSILFSYDSCGFGFTMRPLAYSKCCRKVLLVLDDNHLRWYDLDKKLFNEPMLEVPLACILEIFTCLQSLVLLNNGARDFDLAVYKTRKDKKGNSRRSKMSNMGEAGQSSNQGPDTTMETNQGPDTTMETNQGPDTTMETSITGQTLKRERSTMWDYFTKIFIKGSNTQYTHVMCNYCKANLKCKSSSGTSTMRNHAKRCMVNPYCADLSKQSLLNTGKNENDPGKSPVWKFDQEQCRAALAKMIIIDELPFVTSERHGFRGFVNTLQPKFKLMSRFTTARDCLKLYASERSNLMEFIKNNVQRVSLTTDLWTSLQNQSYLCLTGHFIDKQWNLHKKILNFCVIGDHTGDSIGKLIESCLKDWGIERVFTITVDNASANDVGIAYLRRKLVARNNAVLDGKYLHVRCCAHILNLIVRDGLSECDASVKCIRATVKYIRSSPRRLKHFNTCVEQEYGSAAKLISLPLDVPTRWNSTFIMLSTVLKFEKAIQRMAIEDMFEGLNDGPPVAQDWEQAKLLVKFLVIFYDCTNRLSGTSYVTSALYFQEVCTIKSAIMEYGKSNIAGLRVMAMRMMEKFEKYWESLDKVNLMLMVAAVLDPRVKLTKLEFLIDKLKHSGQNCGLLVSTQETLKSLFKVYNTGTESATSGASSSVGASVSEQDSDMLDHVSHVDIDVVKNWDIEFEQSLERSDKDDGKTELDRYLGVKNVKNDANFDILGWWKMNASEYPVLSTMAKDILAVPVSTVASESAFSTGSRVLDQFRSSLTPKTAECLICAQDWLRGSPLISAEETLETLNEIEREVVGLNINDADNE